MSVGRFGTASRLLSIADAAGRLETISGGRDGGHLLKTGRNSSGAHPGDSFTNVRLFVRAPTGGEEERGPHVASVCGQRLVNTRLGSA